jgi:hypothetical protein
MKFHLFLALGLVAELGLVPRAAGADPSRDFTQVESFAFGGIGVAGTTSPGEIAFREVLARSDADERFRQLLEVGNREAKCYALVALRNLESRQYPELAARFRKDQATVKTIAGCSPMELPMSAVVAAISGGNYDVYLSEKRRPQAPVGRTESKATE